MRIRHYQRIEQERQELTRGLQDRESLNIYSVLAICLKKENGMY